MLLAGCWPRPPLAPKLSFNKKGVKPVDCAADSLSLSLHSALLSTSLAKSTGAAVTHGRAHISTDFHKLCTAPTTCLPIVQALNSMNMMRLIVMGEIGEISRPHMNLILETCPDTKWLLQGDDWGVFKRLSFRKWCQRLRIAMCNDCEDLKKLSDNGVTILL